MDTLTAIRDFLAHNPLFRWLAMLAAATLIVTLFQSFFRARKIQPNGFSWKTFRNEIFFSVLALTISTFLLGASTKWLTSQGFIQFNHAPAAWWVVLLEYAGYWVAFDTYFYWMHRGMHHRRVYPWIHKIHHFSTAPNVLTTTSLNPLESYINGICIPLFTAMYAFHDTTMAFIGPTNILMGFYVHSGYEFLPRWWNKTWLSRWFITATFHDQHHKYFNYNFGGFTPIWDAICGTTRPKYLADFDELKARASASPVAALPAE